MAKQQDPNPDPLITLTDDAREMLEKLDGDIEGTRKYLDTLDELGIDSSRLRANFEASVKIRDAALNLFKK
jgi:hypothetical protein